MSPQSKQEYFEAIHKRYKEASRKKKTISSLYNEQGNAKSNYRVHPVEILSGK